MCYQCAINIPLPMKSRINNLGRPLIPKTKPNLKPEGGIKALGSPFIRSLKTHKDRNKFYMSSELLIFRCTNTYINYITYVTKYVNSICIHAYLRIIISKGHGMKQK